MGEKVTVPAELRAKLATANGTRIPLCDESGNVIGYALTPTQMAKCDDEHKAVVESLDSLWPADDIKRIIERSKNDQRPKRTMAEVMRLVEGD